MADQGFPGEARASVTYALLDAQTLEITYTARGRRTQPGLPEQPRLFSTWMPATMAPAANVREHSLQITAARYLPVGAELIPLGELAAVSGTSF